jgi:hypothetical protein
LVAVQQNIHSVSIEHRSIGMSLKRREKCGFAERYTVTSNQTQQYAPEREGLRRKKKRTRFYGLGEGNGRQPQVISPVHHNRRYPTIQTLKKEI